MGRPKDAARHFLLAAEREGSYWEFPTIESVEAGGLSSLEKEEWLRHQENFPVP
jgi:hypothetical protein